MTHSLHYSMNGFSLGDMCNSLAERGVPEENLISITEEVGLAKGSRPGTGRYLFSRGLKHAGAVASLGVFGGLLFAFFPDLADGTVDLSPGFYAISSLFGIVAGYSDWYSEYENSVPYEVVSPLERKAKFRSSIYTLYHSKVLRILEEKEEKKLKNRLKRKFDSFRKDTEEARKFREAIELKVVS